MSKYTMQLRWIVEQVLSDAGAVNEMANWPLVYPKIGLAATGNCFGLSPYPVETEAMRKRINDKIIQHYYLKEMGTETVGQFGWRLNEAMNLIMPYYNNLYQLKVLDASHLIGADYTDTIKVIEGIAGESTGNGTSTVHSETGDDFTGRSLDTPQARIANLDDGWLTRAEKTNSSGTGDSDTTSTSKATSNSDRNRTDEHVAMRYDPSLQKQLLTIGRELLNIDRMIVEDDEINSCFMLVW